MLATRSIGVWTLTTAGGSGDDGGGGDQLLSRNLRQSLLLQKKLK